MDYNSIKVSELKDNEVGKRIKAFSKRFFYMAIFVLLLNFVSILIYIPSLVSDGAMTAATAIFILIFSLVISYLWLLVFYFIFIKSYGFGIIVQDINYIKTNLDKLNGSEPIYCSICGEEVSDNDKECPHCGASFEE